MDTTLDSIFDDVVQLIHFKFKNTFNSRITFLSSNFTFI